MKRSNRFLHALAIMAFTFIELILIVVTGIVREFIYASRPHVDFRIESPPSLADVKTPRPLAPIYDLSMRTNAQNLNRPMLLA
jgi:hypothetical protein